MHWKIVFVLKVPGPFNRNRLESFLFKKSSPPSGQMETFPPIFAQSHDTRA